MKRAAAVAVAGLALILVALLFDAAPLFVPGVAITLLGVVAPAWVALAARGASIERTLDSQRVVEEEPIEATIEVRRGHWGLPGAAVVRSARRRVRFDPHVDVDRSREARARACGSSPRSPGAG